MATPGPVVHQQLMDAYAAIQSELEAERAKFADVRQQRDELAQSRRDTLARLAEHYLPDLSRDSIDNTWSEVQTEISSILLRKEDHQRRLQDELDLLTQQLRDHQQQLADNRSRLDDALAEQQAVTEQVESRLRADDQFVELTDRAAVAEAALERAESNLAEIDQDAARKLPAYESSTLFRYLYDRKFGTSEYDRRGFTRRMDRTLARFIDFQKARSGYDFLKNTPDQMRKLIAEDRRALDTVMDELEQRRDRVAADMNLHEYLRKTESLTAERDRHLDALDHLQERIQTIESELAELEDTRGTYYQDAVELFRRTLERIDPEQLKSRARQTVEITDDQIVARLRGVDLEREELDESTRQRRKELDQQHEFLAGLGRIIQRFRAAQFDSARSHFVGSLDILAELEQVRAFHEISHLWKRIRRAQRWGDVRSGDATDSNANPMARILVNAMSHASDQSRGDYAKRAGDRRVGRDSFRGGSGDDSGQ